MNEPFQEPDTDLGVEDLTPLREAALEAHEMYVELVEAGFPERAISQIVAHYLYDVMDIRYGDVDYDIGEDDDDEDSDLEDDPDWE